MPKESKLAKALRGIKKHDPSLASSLSRVSGIKAETVESLTRSLDRMLPVDKHIALNALAKMVPYGIGRNKDLSHVASVMDFALRKGRNPNAFLSHLEEAVNSTHGSLWAAHLALPHIDAEVKKGREPMPLASTLIALANTPLPEKHLKSHASKLGRIYASEAKRGRDPVLISRVVEAGLPSRRLPAEQASEFARHLSRALEGDTAPELMSRALADGLSRLSDFPPDLKIFRAAAPVLSDAAKAGENTLDLLNHLYRTSARDLDEKHIRKRVIGLRKLLAAMPPDSGSDMLFHELENLSMPTKNLDPDHLSALYAFLPHFAPGGRPELIAVAGLAANAMVKGKYGPKALRAMEPYLHWKAPHRSAMFQALDKGLKSGAVTTKTVPFFGDALTELYGPVWRELFASGNQAKSSFFEEIVEPALETKAVTKDTFHQFARDLDAIAADRGNELYPMKNRLERTISSKTIPALVKREIVSALALQSPEVVEPMLEMLAPAAQKGIITAKNHKERIARFKELADLGRDVHKAVAAGIYSDTINRDNMDRTLPLVTDAIRSHGDEEQARQLSDALKFAMDTKRTPQQLARICDYLSKHAGHNPLQLMEQAMESVDTLKVSLPIAFRYQEEFLAHDHFPTSRNVAQFHEQVGRKRKRRKRKERRKR